MEYILSAKDDGCFLCRSISEPEKDKDHFVLFRGEFSLVIMNLFPYNNGHVMVAPYRHGLEYEEYSLEVLNEINTLSQKTVKIMKETMNPHGFNLGYNLGQTAGAGLVDHIHFHIVPRWNGDTNFMPVLGKTRVISESLEDTYHKLINKF